jgi:chemotaxis protein methyltransferase CheR/type IV pilus assembly protein PilK
MTEQKSESLESRWAVKDLPEMSDELFALWQTLLEDRTGMRLTMQRKSFLQTSLSMRMREVNCVDYQEYYTQVTTGPLGAVEWSTLVDRLTVQETRFFRDPEALSLVADVIKDRIDLYSRTKPLEIWSVGCSSGEEPYSLAITADSCFKEFGLPSNFNVTGTDISLPVLSKARNGIFYQRKLNVVPEKYRNDYFDSLPNEKCQVKEELRNRCCFARINVLELDKSPMHGMDIIFSQNLLIYFRRWRRKDILNRLVERLAPGGVLVIGMGEMVDWKHPDLVPVGHDSCLAYFKRSDRD